MAEVQYLGHRGGGRQIHPETAEVEAILNWPRPLSQPANPRNSLTCFYYRRFVPQYSTLAKPLTDLTKKRYGRQIVWSPECVCGPERCPLIPQD